MLIQDFTACGLGTLMTPRVDWIPNTERHVGQSPAYKLEAHSGFSLQCFSWNTFSRGNKAVSGGLVLPPTIYLTLAEMGLHINGGFLLFPWKNAALVVTWNSESGDHGIRLWMKLPPYGDNSLPFYPFWPNVRRFLSPPPGPWVSGCSFPLIRGTTVCISQSICSETPQRRGWPSRCCLRETGTDLDICLQNFYIFYVLSLQFINFRLLKQIPESHWTSDLYLLEGKILFTLQGYGSFWGNELGSGTQWIISRCHLPSKVPWSLRVTVFFNKIKVGSCQHIIRIGTKSTRWLGLSPKSA